MPSRRVLTSAAFALASLFALYALVVLLTPPESGANEFVTRWLYQGLIAVSALVAGARAVVVRKDRVAWGAIALGLAATSFAELYTTAVAPTNYPSVADFGWLAFYPLTYVGIVLLIRQRARSVTGTLWLDGLIASVAAAAFGAAVLVEVVLSTSEGSTSAVATNVAYPLGDVLLLSAVFGVFSLAGWRLDRRWIVLGLGILATTVADAVYLLEVTTYQAGSAIDILWPASNLLIAGAAWIDTRAERTIDIKGRPLLAVPAVCALFAIGILVVDHFSAVNVLAVALSALTLLLVIARLGVTFRENALLYALTHAGGDHRRAHGSRQPPQARRRPRAAPRGGPVPETLLMIFDLDGFKGYNDSFGHPAGRRIARAAREKLATVPGADGGAYRLGGDEFCLVARAGPTESRGADRPCVRRAHRARRGVRRLELVRRRDAAGGGDGCQPRARARRRAPVRAEALAARRPRPLDGRPPRGARGPRTGPPVAPRRGRGACREGGRAALAPPRRAR